MPGPMHRPTRMTEPADYKSVVGPDELAALRVEDVARRAEDADPLDFVGAEADAPADAGVPAGPVDTDAEPADLGDEPAGEVE